jgi:pyruvate/2-oxoglutarate dehydrogenase complex dihydrolipoamide acyltransferase (E2) component
MPPLGETMEEGQVAQWYKEVGDPVAKREVLMAIETDKVTVEVESFGAGVLRKILVPEGLTVKIGTLLAIIADPDEDISAVTE